MIPFLKQVAKEYYGRGNIERTCFVFPNRRSMVFFKKYLGAEVASAGKAGNSGAVPLLMPETFTINDFMGRLYGGVRTDRVSLLLKLYECYSALNPKAESLDDFIYWGDVLLSDFNDVDKYLVDAGQLFTNVSDFKALQDTFSYLTERQRVALEHFSSHFRNMKGGGQGVKENFVRIWNLLRPLYGNFREALAADGMAYEGMVYRDVAEAFLNGDAASRIETGFPRARLFVFTGLNALNECEKTVMRKMRDASLAEFCWDYSGSMIKDAANRSSVFLSGNVREFPMTFALDEEDNVPETDVISVSSAVGQAKQLPRIFSEIAGRNGRDLSNVGLIEDGGKTDCAVILPDENLLMPVLNTIPSEIGNINVTMGYPMSCSTFHSFVSSVIAMQMNTRVKDGKTYFYHRHVREIFSNGIFRTAAGEDGNAAAAGMVAAAEIYMSREKLSATDYLSLLFRPVITDRNVADKAQIAELTSYLLEIIGRTALLLKKSASSGLEIEFAKEYHDCIRTLGRKELSVLPKTYSHLLQQLVSSVSVPFKGEPLQGLQIMGPLETRALDFHNVIILSANEGVFPKRNVSNSFIPPELRRGFGLPTYEYQDAVWAYYFYRLISKAEKVWILYDSRTEGLKSGEESRYIKQLQYHFGVPMRRYTVAAALSDSHRRTDIAKTDEDVRIIREMTFSASALQTYLSCQLEFYYRYVKKLKAAEEVTENMDNGMLGRVYHAVMQTLYSDTGFVDRRHIGKWMHDEKAVRQMIYSLIMEETHAFEVTGRNLVTADVILRYVKKTLERDRELMEHYGTDGFTVFGLEQEYSTELFGYRFKGYVDRLDSFTPDTLRVVDYKTGIVTDKDIFIDDGSAEDVAEALFGPKNVSRPKIALQLYIYDRLLGARPEFSGKKLVNCIYSASQLFASMPEQFTVSEKFVSIVDGKLSGLLSSMTDIDVPFAMTEDDSACEYCDFRKICGK